MIISYGAMGKVKIDPRPAPPVRPSLDIKETRINLKWHKAEDLSVMGYHIYRSPNQEGPYLRLNKDLILNPVFSDNTVQVDTNYFYTITSVNKGGFESMRSLAALGVARDTTPPPVVQTLTIKLEQARVKLQWKGVKAPDLQGYRVYRTMTPENMDWTLLNRTISVTNFVDGLTKNLSRYPYYYRVTSIDTHFNESPPSESVKIQLPDVTPPNAPTFSASSVRNGQVALTWTVTAGYDFMGYYVYRTLAGHREKITPNLLVQPSFVDMTPPVDKPLSYIVVAVDKTGNESAPSKAINLIVRDHLKPRITSFTAAMDKGNVVLTLVSKDKDLAGFDVLRSQNNRDFIKINTSRVKDFRFVDNHVLKGKRLFYKIILWDTAANKTRSVVRQLKVQ